MTISAYKVAAWVVSSIVVVVLILLIVFGIIPAMTGKHSSFVDPGWSEGTDALLAYHEASDPASAAAMAKIYGSKESFADRGENPKLVAMLYK
jgi:hypothetical protein